jgi:Protein of unknown function (DUF3592)
MAESIARRAAISRRVGMAYVLASGLFFCLLLHGSWVLCPDSIQRLLAARNWPEATCTVLTSEVRTHTGRWIDTFSVKMSFRYEVNGVEFTADTYDFATNHLFDKDAKQRVVDAHPPGTVTRCYYNPADPREAIINRRMTADMWASAWILVFPLLGLWAVLGMANAGVRKWRENRWAARRGSARSRQPRASVARRARRGTIKGMATYLPDFDPNERSVERSSCPSRLIPAAILLPLTLVWNGFLGLVAVEAIGSGLLQGFNWLVALFTIPFLAVGLGFLALAIYLTLAVFNPMPVLTLDRSAVEVGGSVELHWRMRGALRRIGRFTITLVGQEEAEYGVGTTTSTDRATFFEAELIETNDTNEMRSGSLTVAIPEGAMHSIELDKNKIRWLIRVGGEIRRWPNISDDFDLVVLPKRGLS